MCVELRAVPVVLEGSLPGAVHHKKKKQETTTTTTTTTTTKKRITTRKTTTTTTTTIDDCLSLLKFMLTMRSGILMCAL